MSQHANILGYKLTGNFVSKLDDERNNYTVRIENAAKDFVHIPYISSKPLAQDRNELIGAFRKILISATMGANKPEIFCSIMRIKPSDPKAPELFAKAREVCEQIDEIIPMKEHGQWFNLARHIEQQGVSQSMG